MIVKDKTDYKLKSLSVSAEKNRELYQFDKPDPSVLETFDAPKEDIRVKLECTEHTSLCPVTGQPDYAHITIEYNAKNKCLETKSLKIYLMGYHNYGVFAEKTACMINDHLVEVLDPYYLKVVVRYASRGGIVINAVSEYRDRGSF